MAFCPAKIVELVQLSHHSLVQYRLPSTGELVPLHYTLHDFCRMFLTDAKIGAPARTSRS